MFGGNTVFAVILLTDPAICPRVRKSTYGKFRVNNGKEEEKSGFFVRMKATKVYSTSPSYT